MLSERLERQAAGCRQMGSLFYGALLKELIEAYRVSPVVRDLLDRHADRSRIGLRVLGAAHFRALSGASPEIAAHFPSTGGDANASQAWRAIAADIEPAEDVYDALIMRPVQTNEVARSIPLLGAMLTVAHSTCMPLRIFEIGSSAGLLLNLDRYRYVGSHWTWGDVHARLTLLDTSLGGTPQYIDAPLEICERRGCDIHPLDASDPRDANTLLSFVWPDQAARFSRLRSAIEVAHDYPLQIDWADGVEWIESVVDLRPHSVAVLMHTVITEHMDVEARERLRFAIERTGALATSTAPFAWVRMEPASGAYATTATIWPTGKESHIARSDGHAQNIHWGTQAA